MVAKRGSRTYKGLGIAPGVAVGRVKVVDGGHFPAQVPSHTIAEGDMAREIERFRGACAQAREDLNALADRVEAQLGRREADLVRPEALMVEDPAFLAEVEEIIIEEQKNAEAAVAEVAQRFERLIAAMDDPYLRERSTDVRDAGRRILANLLFVEGELVVSLTEPCIVVASHLVPSLAVRLEREMVRGLVTEHGGYTSHAAILARTLGIPAVTGLPGIIDEVTDGETLVVNGSRGTATVRPTRASLRTYTRLAQQHATDRRRILAESSEPAVTRDGVRVVVQANVGRPEEIELAREYHADGIGLYRTEFEYLTDPALPSEEALYEHYARAARAFPEGGVTIRVLDIGGDKFPPSVPLAHEDNPFMGLRGLRLLLERAEELMLPQLRAIIRAAAHGPISIMYPMVTGVEDMMAARKVFARAAAELGEPNVSIEQGVMVEVPSCVHMLGEMLRRGGFASVGTNDLVQYVLAADRNSERMADAYDPFHPAVIRILEEIRRTCRELDRPVSVCGEVTSDPHFLPMLLGLGYRTLSVNVGALAYVKHAVRGLSLADCEALAELTLRADTAQRVHRAVRRFARAAGPGPLASNA
ncbi:MAG: phosphoenolpyruvate--protein phosphotransferase [Candidatus Brocadiia bacterium]|jgi:phosphotransferase system enzyme I (PtsI)|nr:phosphoenolpyruvate--protein phosphotransferase [Candidatus Brocadiia bacterium]